MAKNQKAKQAQIIKDAPQQEINAAPVADVQSGPKDFRSWFYDFKPQAIIVSLLALVIYFNSFSNEYAHDDGIVIVKNEYVLEGFAGIKNILTKDAYDSYYRQLNTTNQLKGGRFRPLSILTFAIEQQFLGPVPVEQVDSVLKQTIAYGVSGPGQEKLISNMHFRHVINVLWYILSVVVLLYFLRYIVFKNNPLMAFIATLIFTAHPIHTEVVANVKSRDEIMSLLFMCLTFIFAFKYEENKKNVGMFAAALFSYFCAFLSKEYAITVIALLPIALIVFKNYSIQKSITTIIPYFVVITFYFALRINVLAPSDDAAEADFVLSIFPKLATIAAIIALVLFVRVPKKAESDTKVLIRNVLYFLPYVLFAVAYLFKRYQAVPEVIESASKEVLNNPYLFAKGSQKIATEIATSLDYLKLLIFPHPLSADYSFDTIPYKDFGNPLVWLSIIVHMAMIAIMLLFFPLKRAFQSGVSATASKPTDTDNVRGIFCFAITFYLIHLILVCNVVFDIGATMGERLIYHSSVGFAIAVAFLLVKGTEKFLPSGSAHKVLAGVTGIIIVLFSVKTIARNGDWKNDSTLFGQDIKTVPNSVLVNANVAASYITLADLQKDPKVRTKYLEDAVKILDHTLHLHHTFVAAYLNRGIAWYKLGDVDKAKSNVDSVRKLYPTYPTLPGMYKLISDFYLRNGWESYGKVGRYPEAIEEYKKGLAIDSTNVDLWYNMGGAYFTNKQFPEAARSFEMSLKLRPDNNQARQGLSACMEMMKGGNRQVQVQPAQQPQK